MEHIVSVTTTGSAGSAAGTGSTDFPVTGFIESVAFDFHASAPATTDTVVAEGGGSARTLLTLSNTKTDVVNYPRVQATDNAGAAIAATYGRYYVEGQRISVTLAQCDALTNALVVRINVSER